MVPTQIRNPFYIIPLLCIEWTLCDTMLKPFDDSTLFKINWPGKDDTNVLVSTLPGTTYFVNKGVHITIYKVW